MDRRRARWLAGLTGVSVMALAALIVFVVHEQKRGPSVGHGYRMTVDPGDECGRFGFEIKGWYFYNVSAPSTHRPMTGVFAVTERSDGFATGFFRPDAGAPVEMTGARDQAPQKLYCHIES